jgi:uncharacterized protein
MPKEVVERPVRPDQRILALDIFRGFAMFGVLIAYCMWSLGTVSAEAFTEVDRLIDDVLSFLVDGKMYTILAFLFGLGFSIQLGRAESDGTAIRFYRRRLAALAAIGLAHAFLLRNGDILLPYALTGFLLIPLRRSPDWVLFFVAGIALLIPPASRAAFDAAAIPMPQRPDPVSASYLAENAAWVRYWWEMIPFTWPVNLVLFLFGFFAGRRRLLTSIAGDTRKLTAMLVAGLVAATGFYLLLRMQLAHAGAPSFLRPTAIFLSYHFHCWGLSSAYVAAMLLGLRTAFGTSLLTPLAAIGRIALTNYLLQAAVIVPLCIIFDWFDRFTPSTAILLAMAVFALQLAFSLVWLRRYQYGPVEWFWRLLTYGRAPPLKARAAYVPV